MPRGTSTVFPRGAFHLVNHNCPLPPMFFISVDSKRSSSCLFCYTLQVLILKKLGKGAAAVGVNRRSPKRALHRHNCTKGIIKSQGKLGEKSGVERELIRF